MTILAATDRSQNSVAALVLALRLAEQLGERLVVVSAVELWERSGDAILPTFEGIEIPPSEHAQTLVEDFVAKALPGRDVDVHVVVGHPPAEHILEVANELGASLIVAGTSGQSKVTEAFFGSTISALARRSTVPVLAVPPGFDRPIQAILAPVDFSECSEASLVVAAQMADKLGAKLFVQHSAPFGVPTVAPPIAYVPESPAEVTHASNQRLKGMIAKAGLTDRVQHAWSDLGPPHPDIMRAVEERGIDLIVMGTHARGAVARFFLGSTAERVLRERTCPVLVVRRREGEP